MGPLCELLIGSFITLSSHQNIHEAFSSAKLDDLLCDPKLYFIPCSSMKYSAFFAVLRKILFFFFFLRRFQGRKATLRLAI